jgi:hypothetical protein
VGSTIREDRIHQPKKVFYPKVSYNSKVELRVVAAGLTFLVSNLMITSLSYLLKVSAVDITISISSIAENIILERRLVISAGFELFL